MYGLWPTGAVLQRQFFDGSESVAPTKKNEDNAADTSLNDIMVELRISRQRGHSTLTGGTERTLSEARGADSERDLSVAR